MELSQEQTPANLLPPAASTNPAPDDSMAVVSTARDKNIRVAILIGALVMLFAGQHQIFRDPPNALSAGNLALLVFGLVLMIVVLGRTMLVQPDAVPTIETTYVEPFRIKIGWLAASIGLAAFASYRSVLKPQEAYLGEYIIVWIMTMLTLLMAVLPSEGQPFARDKHPIRTKEWLLIGVLLLAGLAARTINLGTVPYLMDQDEAKFATEGAELRVENFLATPFEPGVDSHPRIFQLMISVAVGLLGPTLAAARLPSAIMGAFGVPALYLLGREIYGWRVGLVSALFMIPWAYHIQFSRLSMNQPADPLFATLAFYFLLRGLRRGATVDFAASGIFLGVAQMFYLGGRLAPVVMVSYLVYQTLRQPQVITKYWRHLLLIPFAALLITLPQNYYLLHFQEPLSTRADKSILLNGELQYNLEQGMTRLQDYLVDQFRGAFSALISNSDRSGWYGRGSPIMGPVGGALLLLGVIVTLAALWKYPKYCIPIGWGTLIIIVMSALAISPPQYERFYPGVSAYALLLGAGVGAVGAAFAKVTRQPELRNRVILIVGVLLCAANAAYYIYDYVPVKGYLANRPNWVTNRVASQMLESQKAGRYVVLVGGWDSEVQNTVVITYFNAGKQYTYADQPLNDYRDLVWQPEAYQKPLTFIIAKSRIGDLNTIMAKWPGGQAREVHLNEDDSIVFYVYDVNINAEKKPISVVVTKR